MGSSSLFMPDPEGNWWRSDLGRPGATGSQNNVRYAYFSNSRRLAIKTGGEVGDTCTFVAIDPETKLIPTFKTGKRDAETTRAFVSDLAKRLRKRPRSANECDWPQSRLARHCPSGFVIWPSRHLAKVHDARF